MHQWGRKSKHMGSNIISKDLEKELELKKWEQETYPTLEISPAPTPQEQFGQPDKRQCSK